MGKRGRPKKKKEPQVLNMAQIVPLVSQLLGTALSVEFDFDPPAQFTQRVQVAKSMLDVDYSGIVVTIVEFMINAIAEVEFKIETDSPNLTEKLNTWLKDINLPFNKKDNLGLIPVGFQAFVKEYVRERLTSSLIVSKAHFVKEEELDLVVPTQLWVLDGEKVTAPGTPKTLSELKYNYNGEPIKNAYIHKLCRWYEKYPTPYLIKRVYPNWALKKFLKEKGADLIRELLILLLIKKGDKNRNITYSSEEYQDILTQLKSIVRQAKENKSTPAYATDVHTEIEHIIPDLSKILSRTIYEEVDRDILSGLGLIDIVQGISSTRRESVLNPKPLIYEVYSTVADIKQLLVDIMRDIIEKNKGDHSKYFSEAKKIRVVTTPVKAFWSDDFLSLLRSFHDRGLLDKKTTAEILGFDFETLIKRREEELRNGYEIVLSPYMIMNTEKDTIIEERIEEKMTQEEEEVPEDRINEPESTNFQSDTLHGAPYKTIGDLPKRVKDSIADTKLKKIFMNTFNSVWNQLKDLDARLRETRAIKAGWSSVSKYGYKGKDGKWHLKDKYKSKKKIKASLIISELNRKVDIDINLEDIEEE